ncbi:glycosyltransferase [Paenibacillus roseipurpureus]|uniref:Glycosyltransferase n=1 Tax=Paenibacillus roseopurpureus TaxID=2918901 RepID=A0AA96RI25_9BACL|nr:glycosyltransferase [Paenibacillus sp. MBLB1832]WNR43878.1 glycosyltransferase [Paenibacillus sp. MBLB1832]
MKILHITETMATGVLKYLQEVIEADHYSGAQHLILYSSKRENTPIDLNKHFPDSVSLIEMNMNFNSSYACIQCIKLLHAQISKIKPDAIHLHSSIAGFLGRIVSVCFPKVKVFYTPHGYSFLMTNKSKVIRAVFWTAEFILSQINGKIIACSKSEFRYANKLSPIRKPFLLENCIKAGPSISKEKIATSKNIIGVGRLEHQKNPKLFIEIIAELKKIDPTINAIWIGDGSLKSDCEEQNYALNAEVNFTGWLSNAKTIEFLEDSMVFLQTSNWEGLPYSVLEAFSIGLPVVASNIESHRDLIDSGYICFISANKKQFVENILNLLRNRELCRDVFEKNRKSIERNYANFSYTINNIYNNK